MHDINQVIDAILLNNPYAVSQKMVEIGVLQEDVYDVNTLKSLIVDATYSFEDGGATFLEYVLDVPVNFNGYEANALIDTYLTNGNKILIREFLRYDTIPATTTQSNNCTAGYSDLEKWWTKARHSGTYLSLETIVLIIAALLMLVLTIAVIKKM